ncbi:bifunctional demethylmenaquinone methyltransferase/2-methoxy-6-polyprenyl-1,4-benzoquinol methylase UbiE [Methylophilus sp. QUAN]|uniref:bifunctional demethylmenaquinone methyltransferase/2-methoxy-6-polyprenyl-1,4-benzoquinol methylase UbiE n=1 Tax=Methylophilus sp. QUAN TaxID=2781020 RepID=UPI00189087A5|nr:bifunctional demethylmenaquinone methyltransferase/2-methoxy-6-polyprenyl-1,4-benzoquinol methylase UbiE [Methylophilus sp. QUAN]MBF4990246.1 bifunctional demethylmenaquinone methyltransferase/2-methoxy-6-polyprenyl-1,4-benzoquinol methylase UbiE [Methylophilus sp. QUAN]
MQQNTDPQKTTHFGFDTVAEADKQKKVGEVFHSVAQKYDIMNDVMSAGMHRLWKRFAVDVSGVGQGDKVLDIAGGSGDLSRLFAKKVGTQSAVNPGTVILTDINASMLGVGRDRMIDAGLSIPATQCNAEVLPFADETFNCVIVAFGLRNMTHKDVALREMQRVLKPGGRLLVLEFSKVWQPLEKLYDTYSFKLLPKFGKWIANDEPSYRYLAESIRMHPDQETLKQMMYDAGFGKVDYYNLTAGVVALHKGIKI